MAGLRFRSGGRHFSGTWTEATLHICFSIPTFCTKQLFFHERIVNGRLSAPSVRNEKDTTEKIS